MKQRVLMVDSHRVRMHAAEVTSFSVVTSKLVVKSLSVVLGLAAKVSRVRYSSGDIFR